jgi:selenocysteine-specific elongation factor
MTAEEISLVISAPVEEVLSAATKAPEVAKLGDLFAIREEIEAARGRLIETLRKRSGEKPESPELAIAGARTALNLAPRLADALLAAMAGKDVRVTESGVSLPDMQEAPPELQEEAAKLRRELRRAGVEPPTRESTPALRLLLKRGEAVDLGNKMFAARETAETLLEEIKAICREEGEISLAAFRDHLGTSRKYAQAWLEYSEAAGVTSRTGDVRVLTRRYR